jgi:superfamily II DNA or RNA helicase
LRFLLADDPGAGKTIMAGLLIKELMVRGDLHRCLICGPGNLAEQWKDELDSKFHLPFEILGRDAIEASRTGTRTSRRTSSSAAWTAGSRGWIAVPAQECRSQGVDLRTLL